MKNAKYVFGLTIIILVAIAYIFNQETTAVAFKTIKMIVDVLVPVLLPFMLLTALLVEFGGDLIIGYFLQYITYPLFKLSGENSILIFLGSITGFPYTAIYGTDICKKDPSHSDQVQSIVNSIFFPSTNFLLLAIASVSSNYYFAFLLTIAIYSSGFFKLFCARSFAKDDNVKLVSFQQMRKKLIEKYQNIEIASSIKSCVYTTFITFIYISGIILIFSTLAHFATFLLPENLKTIALCLFEVTSGVLKLSVQLDLTNLILIAFFLGLSGGSVILQAYTFIAQSPLSFKSFLFHRLLQSLLNIAFMIIIFNIFT